MHELCEKIFSALYAFKELVKIYSKNLYSGNDIANHKHNDIQFVTEKGNKLTLIPFFAW